MLLKTSDSSPESTMQITFANYILPIPGPSYVVTREYPYKWFTPLALIGGTLFTILFSSFNYFGNAYNMVANNYHGSKLGGSQSMAWFHPEISD
ncbi:hypothetical protein E4T39_06985 [Aureobasidium subglaciale]|nr:hypothetical protein E4T39_06985 [Aureobasidium subglaciale]